MLVDHVMSRGTIGDCITQCTELYIHTNTSLSSKMLKMWKQWRQRHRQQWNLFKMHNFSHSLNIIAKWDRKWKWNIFIGLLALSIFVYILYCNPSSWLDIARFLYLQTSKISEFFFLSLGSCLFFLSFRFPWFRHDPR